MRPRAPAGLAELAVAVAALKRRRRHQETFRACVSCRAVRNRVLPGWSEPDLDRRP